MTVPNNKRQERPTVLMITTAEDISGGEVFLLSLVSQMRSWAPVIAAPNPELVKRCRSMGLEAEVVPWLKSLKRDKPLVALWRLVVYQPLALIKCWRMARKCRASVIMGATFSGAHFAYVISLLTRRPSLWSHHHPICKPGDQNARIASWLLTKGGMKAVACSHATARGFGPIGLDASRVAVVTSNVDSQRFQRAAPRPDKKGPWVLGLVAMITSWKGHHLLIEAVRILRERGVTADHLVCQFYGGIYENRPHDQEYKENLEKMISDHGLGDQIRFCGKQSDMKSVYETLDIVTNCSTEPEPFGISIVEAMSMECVVIVPDEGGPAEIITHGVDGFRFQPRSATDLADKLAHVLVHKNEMETIRRTARRTACERFSSETVAAHYEEIFQKMAFPRAGTPSTEALLT